MTKTDRDLDTSFYIAGWILIGVAAACLAGLEASGRELLHLFPPCTFRVVTGYYCPGCGATRAFWELIHGRVINAFMYHAFVAYAGVTGGWFMLSQTVERISRHRLAIGMRFRYLYVWIGIGILFLNFVVKDLVLYLTGIHLMPEVIGS